MKLTSSVVGTSGFAKEFSALGIQDSEGRSLREFDLQQRLFKYPCSYLIHTPMFAALPPECLIAVKRRMTFYLQPTDPDQASASLREPDRQAVWEILAATVPLFHKE